MRIREAGAAGITPDDLAALTATDPAAVRAWSWASDAHDLTTFEDGRLTIDDDVADILLDDARSEFLGGQFVHAVVASMDWGGMADFFRTGSGDRRAAGPLQDGHRTAHPTGHRGLLPGGPGRAPAARPPICRGEVVSSTCIAVAGAGWWRWPVASRSSSWSGSSSSTTPSRGRARTSRPRVCGDRIEIREGKATDPGHVGEYDLAYFQYALHQLHDAPKVLAAAWARVATGWPRHRPGLAAAVWPR